MVDLSVVLGGKAGQGVMAAAGIYGRLAGRSGYDVFIRNDYPSLIRGGHNFCEIRISSDVVYSSYGDVDILVCLDENTYDEHVDAVGDGVVVVDGDFGLEGLEVPVSSWVEELDAPDIVLNTGFVGVLAYLTGFGFDGLVGVLRDVYGDRAEVNVEIADKAFSYCRDNFEKFVDFRDVGGARPFLSGNEAVSLGAVSAGLDLYIGYPMTPTTSILHFLGEHKDRLGVEVVQPENEIGVINAALGASYAGARSMAATSGGGFDLMHEGISLAGISETPVLVVEGQRAGPGTGVPTYSSQADLLSVVNAAHGEFPRIVLAPGDLKECFYLAGVGLNLAWRHQTPVTLLMDSLLCESKATCELPLESIEEEPAVLSETDNGYSRYRDTESGVSPLRFPGEEDVVVKNSSYEHDISGITTEEIDMVSLMQDKRLRKYKGIREDLSGELAVNVYGDSDIGILTWGSTKGSVLEARRILDEEITVVQPLVMKPFPKKELNKICSSFSCIGSVEANSTGQLATLFTDKTDNEIDEKFLKYDMRPFRPNQLASEIEERCLD
ncbi:2-oxoacid:acceptor oxidoreductase subunit alpha [Methanonatronarchaeum sp. AMET-Sl]|uniref:2-oxoacid:acceptor oxidoreductase subunit alpha n=1 Tax=Methanonatronarchaeum sp. AMET-Sl TaxID=3037654 RepID=UPI00244E45C0|nr:2-oxoacid:acceptor oxidoreductase subunit alpha [Methanonatronarchaeum sp. AMET-Sl]WGI17115.1 2-oxoacid:acceptor oxidoreductase subunit alpha [Methanonatronarchaeum sp. AMET-Sl]